MASYLVGFDTAYRKDKDYPGGFIFECPQCFEKFWYHAGRESIDLLVEINAWPK
jgi:hypothetical protein